MPVITYKVGIKYIDGVVQVIPSSPLPPATVITKLAFMNRFTDAELVAIYTASKSSVSIEVWIKKLESASDVTLTNAATIAGVNALEKAGFIVAGRAAIILKAI